MQRAGGAALGRIWDAYGTLRYSVIGMVLFKESALAQDGVDYVDDILDNGRYLNRC